MSVGAFLVGAGMAGRLDRDLRAARRRFIAEIGGEGILIAAAAIVAYTVVVKPGSPGAYVTIGLLALEMGARNDTISRLSVQTNLTTTVLTSALTGLARCDSHSDAAQSRANPASAIITKSSLIINRTLIAWYREVCCGNETQILPGIRVSVT